MAHPPWPLFDLRLRTAPELRLPRSSVDIDGLAGCLQLFGLCE